MGSIKERVAALQASQGGGELFLGSTPSATATPTAAATDAAAAAAAANANVGEVEAAEGGAIGNRVAALNEAASKPVERKEEAEVGSSSRPVYGTSSTEQPPTSAPPSLGRELASGWLSKSGKGPKQNTFDKRWVVIHEGGSLGFYDDETQSVARGAPLPLHGATVAREKQDKNVLVLSTPAEDVAAVVGIYSRRVNVTKLRGETLEETELWATRIEAAISERPLPA